MQEAENAATDTNSMSQWSSDSHEELNASTCTVGGFTSVH